MKIFCLSAACLILIFSFISVIVVKYIYDGQFTRNDRPDETITAGLRYTEIETGYPRRLVIFKSGDNNLQSYVYGSGQDRGLVVVSHGLGGGADSYLSQITYFVDKGWRVFAYDATGSYDSEGKSTKGFPQSLLDLDAALTYISADPDLASLPIMLFGHSWGGYAVTNILHYDHDIAGVVSVSGVNSSMAIVMEQGRRMLGNFIYTQYPFLWLYQRILFGKPASFTAVDAINDCDVPVFIIHGTQDDTVEYGGSSVIARAAEFTNPNVRLLPLDEPGHSGHNDIFRSPAAAAYINGVNIKYSELYNRYDGAIPYDIKQEFYAGIDRTLAQELNAVLMDEINAFMLDCLKQ